MTIENISIGENRWIPWIDIDHNSEVYEFDLLETKPLWECLETECVAECCGIGAFVFWRDDIVRAKTLLNNPTIKQAFINLKESLISNDYKVISNTYLNNVFDKGFFINLLDHIIENL